MVVSLSMKSSKICAYSFDFVASVLEAPVEDLLLPMEYGLVE